MSDSLSSSGTTTTHLLTISYNSCRDDIYFSIANGTISATHTLDTTVSLNTTSVVMNLTDASYTDLSYTVQSDIFSLNGTFVNSVTGTTNGSSSATATRS